MAATQIANGEAGSSVRTKLNHLLLGGVSATRVLDDGAGTLTPTTRLVTFTGTAAAGFDITIANGTVIGETFEIEVGSVTLPGSAVRLVDASAVVVVGSIRENHVYRLRWNGTTWLNASRAFRNVNPATTLTLTPGNADTEITEAIVGRHIIVTYSGTLTTDRSVRIHNTVRGPGQITVLHRGTGGFAISVEYEASEDSFDVQATVQQGEEYVTVLADPHGTPSSARHGPITAGALAYLDTVGAAELSPTAISGLPTITSVDSTNDRLVIRDATDGALKQLAPSNLPGGGGGSGDAAPTIVESTGSPHTLAAGQRAAFNVAIHAHQASVDFDVPVNVEGAWIVNAFDEDDGTAYAGCTISVAGNAGSVNGTSGGSREIVAGGFAVVSAIDPTGSAPVVKVTGDIFEPALTRGALNPVTKDDHRKDIQITGTQTFGAATTYPSGFRATYWASGANRTLDGLDADFIILSGASATVFKKPDGSLVAQGVPSTGTAMIVLDAA